MKKHVNRNNLTIFLLVIALVLVSFNYIQTMGLMVELDSIPVNRGTGAVTAPAEGALTVVEFSDFQCPYCSRAAPEAKRLREKYGDSIDFQYKHFPLRSIHAQAQKAAEASECARDQGLFEVYHDGLFATQTNLGISALKKLAQQLQLDTVAFNDCLDSGDKATIVEKDFQEGVALGVTGTPTFFIGGEKIGGAVPFATLDAAVRKQLS